MIYLESSIAIHIEHYFLGVSYFWNHYTKDNNNSNWHITNYLIKGSP